MNAIRRILLVARLEWLEHRRQPAMLVSMVVVFGAVVLLCLSLLLLVQAITHRAGRVELLQTNLQTAGLSFTDPVAALVEMALSGLNVLVFAQLLGMSAVLAGQSVLHDRQLGTLPFLLLSPLRRGELLAGKVLGTAGTPVLLYLVIGGGGALFASLLPITAGHDDRLPFALGWSVAFLVGGPAWAGFVATASAALGSLARDSRTAQQIAWLVVFFVTFGAAYALGSALQRSLAVQLTLAAAGVWATSLALAGGVLLLSRDVR